MQSKPLNSEERPWGRYEDYFRSEGIVFKLIYVAPKQRLSLQYHEQRDEIWIHVSGKGDAIIDGEEIELVPGMRLSIRARQHHRLVNTGDVELVIAETQHGVCSEEDIVRIEDDFGRVE